MPSFDLINDVDFHGVGQGLFSTGCLRCRPAFGRPFYWVYDCGTSSKQKLLKRALDLYELDYHSEPLQSREIDLVTISHFDNDHISGLVSLLGRFRVRTLLLPYARLEKRLAAAIAGGVDSQQPEMQLFLNPVAYLTAVPSARIGQFVFVPGGNGERPSDDQDEPLDRPPEGDWKLEGEFGDGPSERDDPIGDFASLSESGRAAGSAVRMLRPGGRLRMRALWEFVPYNDADVQPPRSKVFETNVMSKGRDLLAGHSNAKCQEALKKLKSIYDLEFGSDSISRNVISLFLYTGPIVSRRNIQISTLYTGDGFLDTLKKLSTLKKFMGVPRMKRIRVLQVMHHGAEKNWHAGVAKSIAPELSVFSCNPDDDRYNHPHPLVFRDFCQYNPVLVDTRKGFSYRARFSI